MITQLTSSRSTSMHVSYPKAMDVWYSSCMMFVFGALIEYAFVNVCVRREKRAHEGGRGKVGRALRDGAMVGQALLGGAAGAGIGSDMVRQCCSNFLVWRPGN